MSFESKATEEHFPFTLFLILRKLVVLVFKGCGRNLHESIHKEAAAQYFSVAFEELETRSLHITH